MAAMRASGIGPGPLGIAETSPSASAPCSIASSASSTEAMQQIFRRVRIRVTGLGGRQRLVEVRDQLVHRLDAQRDANEIVGDADALALFRRQSEVRAARWPHHERFDPAQARRMN